MTSATERLPRLLALVPYLVGRPGIRIAEAARDFGVSETRLRRDLELLWMCGLPGYGPGDLIDLSFDSDSVTVTFDAGMRRPLRLTTSEATSLLVALRALADTPGITDTDTVRRALVKVEEAVGRARPAGVVVDLVSREDTVPEQVRTAVQTAATRRRALRIRYYTASRDEITDRTVDPMRLVFVEGHSYLEAWCRRAVDVRLFRVDRIDAVELLDEPAEPSPQARPTDFSAGLFRPLPDQPSAVLELEAEAHWVAEYYPVEEFTELEGGRCRVRMRYSDRAWMVRLVLGLGGRARVRSPRDLAELVRQRALDAMAHSRHLPET